MSNPFGPGGFDPSGMGSHPLFREIGKVLAWDGGPVNWDAAQQIAADVDTPRALPPGDRDHAELSAAVTVAELWLDGVTDLPAVSGPVRAMSVEEWARAAATPKGLGLYLEPVATGMAEGLQANLGTMLGQAGDLPPEMSGLFGGGADMLGGVLRKMGAFFYGLQAGTVIGHLGTQLLGTYDLGLPTVEPRTIGSVGRTLERFGAEHGIDGTELRYWLSLREAAHRRQFGGVAWLRERVAELMKRFAASAELDPEQLTERFGGLGLDPSAMSDPSRLREALESGAFEVEPTPAQREVLAALQALVSFTSAWVDTVVRAAAGDKLPSLTRIEEANRSRRAGAGPGEQFLSQLVGLDLKPADLEAGRRFCDAVLAARGQAGLDRVWAEARLLPGPTEIADPSRWLVRLAAEEDAPSPEVGEVDVGDFTVPDDLSELDDPK